MPKDTKDKAESSLSTGEEDDFLLFNHLGSVFNLKYFPLMVYFYNFKKKSFSFISDNTNLYLGFKPTILLNKSILSFYDLINPEQKEIFQEMFDGILNEYSISMDPTRCRVDTEIMLLDNYENYRWFRLVITIPQGIDSISPGSLIFLFYDVTENKFQTDLLRWQEREIKSLLQNLPDLVIRIDSKFRCLYVNSSVHSFYEFLPEEIVGKKLDDLYLSKDIIKNIKNDLIRSLNTGKILDLEFSIITLTGRKFFQARIVPEILENGLLKSALVIITDNTAKKLAEETLAYSAEHDSLTGLKNREYFLKIVDGKILKFPENKNKFSVIFFDIDKFQEVNDSLGHLIGDELLKIVASKISGVLNSENFFSRMGGDEFAAIIEASENSTQILSLLMKISALFAKPISLLENEIYTSISIGVASFPDHGFTSAELIQNADKAMYHSKRKEYNTFTFYKEEMGKATLKKKDIIHSLRRGIEKKEFNLLYQPKIDLRTMKVTGAEALLRWNSQGSWISPVEFIPAAEESGLIIPIGEWVLEKAMKDLSYLHSRGYDKFCIAVNLSAKQFQIPGISKQILNMITQYNIPFESFEIEITEGVAMKNVNLSESILREFDAKGIKISIDDFGTGHSSLAYLNKFPIDILKIDRAFIKNLPEDKESAAIIRAVLSMSHELDIEVVAEGVETIEQLDFLYKNNCEYIQGFYFSKPIPLPYLEEYILEKNSSQENPEFY